MKLEFFLCWKKKPLPPFLILSFATQYCLGLLREQKKYFSRLAGLVLTRYSTWHTFRDMWEIWFQVKAKSRVLFKSVVEVD